MQETPGDISELPMLTIGEILSDGMGFEGYMAYDISELVNANPWNDSLELSTLPVYQNQLTYDENYTVSGVDFNKMRKFLVEIARRFGLDTKWLKITSEETKYSTEFITEADDLKIKVDQNLTATISFHPAVSLPNKYNFTHYASYEDISAVAEYLKTEYNDIIDINIPQVNIYGGEYNVHAKQKYSIAFFDANGNDTEQIVNYNFNRVTFSCDDEGKLFLARIYQPDLSQKVGDYPIITSEQARELLSNGNYITSVPYEIPGLEYVKKVELVYRTGEYEVYYMPYYRFYVELPEEQRDNGLKTYGTYYVPAVNGDFISNMPTWNGSFN